MSDPLKFTSRSEIINYVLEEAGEDWRDVEKIHGVIDRLVEVSSQVGRDAADKIATDRIHRAIWNAEEVLQEKFVASVGRWVAIPDGPRDDQRSGAEVRSRQLLWIPYGVAIDTGRFMVGGIVRSYLRISGLDRIETDLPVEELRALFETSGALS